MAVALAEAYQITHNSIYLSRAEQTEAFVLSGEDSAGGGGIYFQEGVTTSKNAISTLQGARAAAMLYEDTGQTAYLTDAEQLVTWADTHIQESNGLFYQTYDLATNSPQGIPLVNAAGIGISANLALYDATGDTSYLTEAQLIGNTALTQFFDPGTDAMKPEGYWSFELVDGLDLLYEHDHNPVWLDNVASTLDYLEADREDSNGHYGTLWERGGVQTTVLPSWNLIDQASVDEAYLFTSTVPEPAGTIVITLGLSALLLHRGLPTRQRSTR